MARLFDDASSQYLEISKAIVSSYPLTMACWFNSNDLTTGQTLICIGDTATDANFFRLTAQGNAAGDPLRAQSSSPTANRFWDTTTGYSANTLHHAAAVFTSASSLQSFIDGDGSGAYGSSANPTPTGLDTTSIGRRGVLTPIQYMSGHIAEAGIWNVALTQAEIDLLAAGHPPSDIRPSNLVDHWLSEESSNPEKGLINSNNMSVIGAIRSNHPRIIRPTAQIISFPTAAAPAGRIMSSLANHGGLAGKGGLAGQGGGLAS